MSRSSELDGVDFRPFFDMVVGILFVLLILVGALIFFQQTQDGVAGSPAEALLARWRFERTRFLERLVADLQARGLPARADTAGGSVLVGLDDLTEAAGVGGLPRLKAAAAAGLAAALTPAVGCVSLPRASDPSCADTDLLFLDGLSVQVRIGATSRDDGLPRERAGRFIAAALSNALYEDSSALLRASDRAGGAVIGFEDGTLGDGQGGGPGDVALVFSFARPPP